MLVRPIRMSGPAIGGNPGVVLAGADPYWDWIYSRPPGYDEDADRYPSTASPESGAWLVWYRALIDPDAEVLPWTEHLFNIVAHSTQYGIFSITDDTNPEYLYYTYGLTGHLGNAVGSILDVQLKVLSPGGLAVNRGSAISIFDGTWQFTAWLRSDGFNIDGEDNIPFDMTVWRRIRLVAKDENCTIYVDSISQQTGGPMNATGDAKVAFGSWVDV